MIQNRSFGKGPREIMGKTHRTAPETLGLSKTTLRQATTHLEPTVRKQEMLGNASQTISGRCRKQQRQWSQ
jgi:hypothetical protein